MKKRFAQIIEGSLLPRIMFAGLLFVFFSQFSFGQLNAIPPIPPKSKTTTKVPKPLTVAKNYLPDPECNGIETEFGDAVEKSIEVSENVNISICVREGEVRINGWDRKEIRAFVQDGTGIGFNILDSSKIDKKPVWVKILGFDPADTKKYRHDECISGKLIELDVPVGATVNIKSGESETSVDSVAKVVVKNVGGDITLNNIPKGVEARTYHGNITLKNSSGSVYLDTTNGNILAYDVWSESAGDSFRAKSNNGAITMQKVRFRETDAYSNSGAINFVGEILSGGQYYFGSSDSLITLVLPETTSSRIAAVYGYGKFESEIPTKDLVRDPNSKLGSLTAVFGSGDALLSFKTINGKIAIKKQ